MVEGEAPGVEIGESSLEVKHERVSLTPWSNQSLMLNFPIFVPTGKSLTRSMICAVMYHWTLRYIFFKFPMASTPPKNKGT